MALSAKALFPEHVPLSRIQAGLKSGKYLQVIILFPSQVSTIWKPKKVFRFGFIKTTKDGLVLSET